MATVPSIGRAVPGGSARTAEATSDLYERFGRQIFAYCMLQLRNREDAEDAVQTTFMNAFRGLERGVVPELESAWLYKIAHHVCQTRRRSWSRRRRVESPEDFENVKELYASPVREDEDIAGLTNALRALPEQQRRAILLREWQGLTYKEIAAEMELSQAAVETLIFRARRGLAQAIEKMRASGDMGSIAAAFKSLFVSGGVKVAATLATLATTSVVAATPAARQQLVHFVDGAGSAVFQTAQKPHHAPKTVTNASSSSPSVHGASVAAAAAVAAAHLAHSTSASSHVAHKVARKPVHVAKPVSETKAVRHDVSTTAPVDSTADHVASQKPAAPATATVTPAAPVTPPATSATTTVASAVTSPPSTAAAATVVAPAVSGFSPASGTAGTVVQITGTGFTGATAVRFYGTSADYSVVSDTQINAKVPTFATSGPVTVVSPTSGDVTSSASFTVIPTPVTFSPSGGSAGTTVTITGRGFTGATAVRFYGTSASFSVVSDTQITAVVPSGATSGPVTVVTTNGNVTSSASFSVAAPTIGFSPSSGATGTTVTITGRGFTGATSVRFYGTSASFSVVSDTQISAVVPSGATTGPVTVVTANGNVTSSASFSVAAPNVEFSPSSGAAGTTVQFSGRGFTGATAVKFYGTSATFTVVSDTQITAVVPSGATTGPVTVVSPTAGDLTSQASFTVTSAGTSAPASIDFSPIGGPAGTTVQIGGRGFTGATAVKFNGTSAISFTVVSDTQLSAVVPAGATTGTVTVVTPGGTVTSSRNFTVTPAAFIEGFSPSSAAIGATIQIYGLGFTGATAVRWGTVTANFTVVSANQITAVVPAGAATGLVTVVTPGGTLTDSATFTVTH